MPIGSTHKASILYKNKAKSQHILTKRPPYKNRGGLVLITIWQDEAYIETRKFSGDIYYYNDKGKESNLF